MEGDIEIRHIRMGVKKLHLIAILCPRVASKYAFKSTWNEFREGRRVILDKSSTSKNWKRKGEEGRDE